jgi:ABC-type multidrug transport system ATPase subunit
MFQQFGGLLNPDHVIEVRGLTKKFKNLVAVNNLDLNVYCGDVFGFLGPNGAGKSTTIRMLLSLIKPTAGSIRIFGMDIKENRAKIYSKIGAIVEKPIFICISQLIKIWRYSERCRAQILQRKKLWRC